MKDRRQSLYFRLHVTVSQETCNSFLDVSTERLLLETGEISLSITQLFEGKEPIWSYNHVSIFFFNCFNFMGAEQEILILITGNSLFFLFCFSIFIFLVGFVTDWMLYFLNHHSISFQLAFVKHNYSKKIN